MSIPLKKKIKYLWTKQYYPLIDKYIDYSEVNNNDAKILSIAYLISSYKSSNSRKKLNFILNHPDLTLIIVEENPDINWDWYNMSRCTPDIFTWEFIKSNLDKPFDWIQLTSIYKTDWEKIVTINSEYWDWTILSRYYSIDLILANPDKPWNWMYISENPNITCAIIRANPGKPWYYYNLSKNANIKITDIIDNIDLPWNWKSISLKKDINIDIILEHLDKSWDWVALCKTIDIVDMLKHKHLPWQWSVMSGGYVQYRQAKLTHIINNLELSWDFAMALKTYPELYDHLDYKFLLNNITTSKLRCNWRSILYDRHAYFYNKYTINISRRMNFLYKYISPVLISVTLEYSNKFN